MALGLNVPNFQASCEKNPPFGTDLQYLNTVGRPSGRESAWKKLSYFSNLQRFSSADLWGGGNQALPGVISRKTGSG